MKAPADLSFLAPFFDALLDRIAFEAGEDFRFSLFNRRGLLKQSRMRDILILATVICVCVRGVRGTVAFRAPARSPDLSRQGVASPFRVAKWISNNGVEPPADITASRYRTFSLVAVQIAGGVNELIADFVVGPAEAIP